MKERERVTTTLVDNLTTGNFQWKDKATGQVMFVPDPMGKFNVADLGERRSGRTTR